MAGRVVPFATSEQTVAVTFHSLDEPRRRASERSHRARREVEWPSVRDCYDDPHRRNLTGGGHSSSRLAPMSLTHRPGDEPHGWCRHEPRPVGPSQWRAPPIA
jgi:hypothetical protein